MYTSVLRDAMAPGTRGQRQLYCLHNSHHTEVINNRAPASAYDMTGYFVLYPALDPAMAI
ncbi:hypothetical protein SUNI508_07092 [Seiridium unicorne]|uniref:Uncharacterized protein n=1 Tax=Seiridium unicorne TaxID=138068 RepID=A0ABR2UYS6_9PEZI